MSNAAGTLEERGPKVTVPESTVDAPVLALPLGDQALFLRSFQSLVGPLGLPEVRSVRVQRGRL